MFSNRVVQLAAIALVAILGVTAFALRGGDPEPEPTPTATPSVTASAAPIVATRLVMDGWSHRIAGSPDTVTFRTATEDVTVDFVALDREGLAELVAERPDIARAVAARMVTADPTLTCDAGGCSAAGAAIALTSFSDAGDVPGLGPVFDGWDIDAVAYMAVVDDRRFERLPQVTVGSVAGEFIPQPGGADDWSRAAVFGAGWGQMFPLTAAWTSGADVYKTSGAPAHAESVLSDDRIPAPDTFSRGLATPEPFAGSMAPDMLTFASSPTTGCAVFALCAPAALDVTATRNASASAGACDQRVVAPSAQGRLPLRLAVMTTDDTVTVDLDGPIHQVGAWNGETPANYLAEGMQTPPLLAAGTHSLEFHRAYEAAGVPPRLFDIVGELFQNDVESGGSATFTPERAATFAEWDLCDVAPIKDLITIPDEPIAPATETTEPDPAQ